jgi:hypothetical protein
MALTRESLAHAARRKTQNAQLKVRAAEAELVTANETLKQAIPRHDVQAITEAAERTVIAEEEVRGASHELEAVAELLQDDLPPQPEGSASGEGVRSLLPYLRRKRR